MTEITTQETGESRTSALMHGIRRTPLFRQLVPQEAGIGWPLPSRRHDRVYATLPFCGMSRRRDEPGRWDLYPPFATLTVDWANGKVVAYRHLGYEQLWKPPEGPVGTFPHSPETASKERYIERRAELLAAYDELFETLAGGGTFGDGWSARFSNLLSELIEPSLKPFYRVLAPKFVGRFLGA